MPGQDIVEDIKTGAFWRLVIRPYPYKEDRLPLEDLLATVSKATLRLRGWDFPHLSRKKPPETRTSYVAASDDFMSHLEHWRMYMSGQFVYLSSVREQQESAWREKLERGAANRIVPPSDPWDWSAVPGFIDVVNFVYTVTEFFEFAARLSQALPGTDSLEIRIGLHNIQGFVLTLDDPLRGWWNYYAADESSLERPSRVRLTELVSSSDELALEAMRWFLVRFGWTEPNMEGLRSDMEELIGKRGH